MASAEKVGKAWERSGRAEFLKQMKAATKEESGGVLKSRESALAVTRAIHQVISLALHKTISVETALGALRDAAALHPDLAGAVMDVLALFDAETMIKTESAPEERATLCQLAKEAESFLSEPLLKERLEIDTLQGVGTVKNRAFYSKFIKVKTKLYYKQRRFNLFREESEGYGKLITELNQEMSDTFTVQNALEIIKSLIGCFNLDPNRVLDIILESFETRPHCSRVFVPLLQNYINEGSAICEVLGAKYRYFADTAAPESLFKVTALLLQNRVFGLDDIYGWLSPADAQLATDWKEEMAEANEFVRRLNVISTKDVAPAEPEEEKFNTDDRYVLNQKWRLCEALLDIGDWTTATELMKRLPDHSVMVNEPVARSLCRLLHVVIEPVYRERCKIAPGIAGKPVPTKDAQILATDFDTLREKAFPMFIQLGPSLHHDPVLLQKLIRLLRVILTDLKVDPSRQSDSPLYTDVLSLLDAAILPALSYMDCNCCVAEEIWTVVRFYPYHIRYSIYARWKNDTYLLHPRLIRRRGVAQKTIKALMKRVSKENIKPVGRSIGKLSHCSPGFLFDYILLQIQIYDNLIGPVVDSLKYLTALSYDVLGYCLIEALASADRDRFKHDGMSLSLWLQSLANFCGAIYKKYNIELTGLLQYVANQLKAQKSLDLLILKEVVQKMAGIEAAEEMTVEQLRAMGGGEILRAEAGYFSQVRNTKKSSQRLKDALAANNLAVALALLIAQQKHCVVYRETTQSHLKLVGKLYDQCQDTLVQFGTFLGANYSVEEYIERLPPIQTMLQEYHIHSDVAFFLARPMFAHAINQRYEQLRKADANAKKLSTAQKQSKYLEATAAIMEPVIESVRPLHPLKVWEDISPQFLCTFWSLSMYDLQVPVESYQREMAKLKAQSVAILESKEGTVSKNKKEQERYIALMEKLSDERKKQQEHVDKIMARLASEKDSWFLSRSVKSAKNETITQFLQLCLFPRCTFTALDAVYCAKFVQIIHSLKTTNFSTLLCYDRIFCDITFSVTSCTENEATRYGRFLCAMLETVMRWHLDEEVFNKECSNYPGFVTKFRVSNQFSEANDHVGYENFRHVSHKWHYKITKAIVFCLDSKDYMQIRNALIILMRILPHFPVLAKLAQIIERKVEKVREEEKNQRQDLFVLASSYIGQLKAKSGQMMREGDFHQVNEKPAKADTSDVQIVNVEKNGGGTTPASAAPATNSSSGGGAAAGGGGEKKKEDASGGTPTKVEKKITRPTPVTGPAPPPPIVIDESPSSTPGKKPETNNDRESSLQGGNKEKKESKRKAEDDGGRSNRKREKERRRYKSPPEYNEIASPSYRGHPSEPDYETSRAIDEYERERGRERERELERERQDRDLSSVSNSSHGSAAQQLHNMDPPEVIEREPKRRKIEMSSSSGKKILTSLSAESSKREKSSKAPKKEKQPSDETKEMRKERRRRERSDDVMISEKRSRKDDDKATRNGGDEMGGHRSESKHHRVRESPSSALYEREHLHDYEREKSYKSSRTRSGY